MRTADVEIRAGANEIDSGSPALEHPPPELIAAAPPDGPLVLVEGHWRLTAYALFPEYLPTRLEILLGFSDGVEEWSEY